MAKQRDRKQKRSAVHRRVRKKVSGTAERPRLAFFKSASHIYGQLIDDEAGRTLASASTLAKEMRDKVKGSNVAAAKAIGSALAEKAVSQKIENAVFDRGGFLYHGAVKAFADAAREKGLKF